ncbi:MAG: IS4 family transposase [Gammaproteobacteria bacterium]|nr:IS4 family transposase [Gammaproteobacteria bacterium]
MELSRMPNQQLYLEMKALLQKAYQGQNQTIADHLLKTLAMLVTGVILGPHVQLYAIALCVPLPIKLLSIVRRFSGFVADSRVDVGVFFAPFIYAMQASLSNETVYLIMDCTKVGPQCRVLMIALVYHGTVLPILWQTLKGKKGHVKGEFQKALLEKVYAYFNSYRQVIILGDAEFSNETVIGWLETKGWGFVFRFQSNYLIQPEPSAVWSSAQALYEVRQPQAGQVYYWENVIFTELHQRPNLTMSIQWAEDELEPLCLISNLPVSAQPHRLYEMRYWIETLFSNCKSRGFDLGRCRMTTPTHIDRLLLAVAIATCVTLGLGTHLIVIGQTDQVDRVDRRDLSLFQLGWRWLYRLLALNRLHELQIVFRWDIELPPPGFQPAR